MTPLWFRLVKDRGQTLPVAGIDQKDLLIVGEGGKACFLYMAERQIGRSKVLECHGLDLVSDLPESNALLGNMVNWLAGSGR